MRRLTTLLALLAMASTASAQAFRDPMRPAGAAPAPSAVARATPIKLEGIISGAVRVAIVNGRVVREGDTVNGAAITQILADGIVLSRAGHLQTLKLPGPDAIPSVRVARSSGNNKP